MALPSPSPAKVSPLPPNSIAKSRISILDPAVKHAPDNDSDADSELSHHSHSKSRSSDGRRRAKQDQRLRPSMPSPSDPIIAPDPSDMKGRHRTSQDVEEKKDEKYTVPKIVLDPEEVQKNLQGKSKRRHRRNSVSAESLDGDEDLSLDSNYQKRVFPKTDTALRAIRASSATSFLFQGLHGDRKKEVFDAMYSRTVEKGEVVYKQGDQSSAFYVIETGRYQGHSNVNKKTQQVFEYTNVGVFGEYALMYNTGQNATVKCVEDGTLWVLDREVFRRVLFLGQRRRHARYESLVGRLKFLEPLDEQTRDRIPDCLQTRIFRKDDWVIKEGARDPQGFFIIEEGKVAVTQFFKGSTEKMLCELTTNDFFGERALIDKARRSANIKVLSDRCIVVRMDNKWFHQLLGPLKKTTFAEARKKHKSATASDPDAPGRKANIALWDLGATSEEEDTTDSEDEGKE